MSGGYDSLIAFWDFEDLMCTGTISENNFQVRKLDFSPCGTYLASLCYDENGKKYILDVYDAEQRVSIALPNPSSFLKTSMHWHPKPHHQILALSGENKDEGIIQLIALKRNQDPEVVASTNQ